MIAIRDPACTLHFPTHLLLKLNYPLPETWQTFIFTRYLNTVRCCALWWHWITLSSKMFFWWIEIDLNCMTVIWYQTWTSGLCKECAVFFNSYKEFIHLYERVQFEDSSSKPLPPRHTQNKNLPNNKNTRCAAEESRGSVCDKKLHNSDTFGSVRSNTWLPSTGNLWFTTDIVLSLIYIPLQQT